MGLRSCLEAVKFSLADQKSTPLYWQFAEERVKTASRLDEANGHCRVDSLVNERVAEFPHLVDSVAHRIGDSPSAPYAGQSLADQSTRNDHAAWEAIEFIIRMIVSSESGSAGPSVSDRDSWESDEKL
jgi:hypothetical protein